jgi:hypothetical protein
VSLKISKPKRRDYTFFTLRNCKQVYIKIFLQKDILKNVSTNLILKFFNHTGINMDQKKVGFYQIYCKGADMSENLLLILKMVLMQDKVLTTISRNDFLAMFEYYKPEVAQAALEDFLSQTAVSAIVENMVHYLLKSEQADVKNYLKSSPHYFPVLIRGLFAYLSNLEANVRVKHLASKTYFSDSKVKLLEFVLENMGKKTSFSQEIAGLLDDFKKELENLQTIEKVLQLNEVSLKNYQFFQTNWDQLQDLKTTKLQDCTLKEIKSSSVYINTQPLLASEIWYNYNLLIGHPHFSQRIAELCKPDVSLPDYFSIIQRVTGEFKTLFSSFADPTKYTLAQYDRFLPRITFKEKSDLYWTVFHALGIPEADKEKIIRFSMIFHSLNKVIKIRQPMLDLLKMEALGYKRDAFAEGIDSTWATFNALPKDKLTIQEVISKDAAKILNVEDLENSLTYKMPMLLKVMAVSPEILSFIKNTLDESLKAMREEVDEENLDLINMVDIINKNLKMLVEESHSFRDLVTKSLLVHKFDQRRLKDFLSRVEPQVKKTIVFLAEKTRKDKNYNKRIIEAMLEDSVVRVRYENRSKKFQVEVYYQEDKKRVMLKPFEFEELLNKARIIAETNSQEEEDEDNAVFNNAMRNFSHFGSQLDLLSGLLLKFRDLGIIHKSAKYLLNLMNGSCASEDYFSIEEGHNSNILLFSYQSAKETSDLDDLKNTNKKLAELLETLTKHIEGLYTPDCYLFSLFYGKRLYYLLEFLRGNMEDEAKIKQVKQVITEFVPENMVNFDINYEIPDDLFTLFEAVKEIMKDWSEKIKYTETVVEPHTKIFASKKLKLSSASENTYKTILKILGDAKQSMVSLSHVIHCTRDTTKGEILSFVKRAMLDPFKKIYFAIGADKLAFEQVVYLKKILLETYRSRDSFNKNLLIFTAKANLFESDDFENIDAAIINLENTLSDQAMIGMFSAISTTKIIISDQAGMGKTSYIHEEWHKIGDKMFEVFFCGEMTKNAVKHRLNNLALVIDSLKTEQDDTFGLTVKLDYIEDFEANYPNIDFLVFSICMIRSFHTEFGCFSYNKTMKASYIEISNTFNRELLATLETLKLLTELTKEDRSKDTSFVVYMPDFSFETIRYLDAEDSNEQVVARFLTEFFKKTTKKRKKKIIKEKGKIKKEDFIYLIKNYFMIDLLGQKKSEKELLQTTFSQYQFWLQTLASMAREMNMVKEFSVKSVNKNLEDDDDDDDEEEEDGDDDDDDGENDEEEEDLKEVTALRKEVMMEIIQFCTYIINVSVSQAKSSQDEMKKLMAEIKKDKNKLNKIMEDYQKKFTGITPWNSNALIVPLFNNSHGFFAMKSVDHIFNNDKVYDVEEKADPNNPKQIANKRKGTRTKLREYIVKSGLYIKFPVGDKKVEDQSTQCMKLLATFIGDDPKDLIDRAHAFKAGKGFVITYENFVKISMIMLKAQLKIPIVMMGESGCGKTYLTQFISECLLQDKMVDLTLYSGVTENDFIDFMKKSVNEAKNLGEGKRMWVFFDEFNTSCLQSIVAEVMIDRVCSVEPSIYKIPENMVFIGCCNPYRMKTKKAEVGLVPKTSDTILSHRVYPIPERLLNYVWDFGQLSEKDEKKHIESMVNAENIFNDKDKDYTRKFINLIYMSHKTVRDIEERSGVSLRDVKRVLKLYSWFKKQIEQLKLRNENAGLYAREEWARAAICAVYMAYGLRLNGRNEEQEKLIGAVASSLKDDIELDVPDKDKQIKRAVKETLPLIAEKYLMILKQETSSIPNNIAINRPLKENFITMLACYDAQIPLIICGAPGTSKTLCSQIFDSAMVTSLIRSQAEFSSFKAIHSLYYGGSQTSTAEGISKVFNRAEHYLEQHGEDTPVVVFDEIGLAELSPYNPLKVLHPLLEKPDQKVGFFGISNWTLDLSKMNRLIYLARPDMGKDDLLDIFKISVNACQDPKTQKDLNSYLNYLADAYLQYRKWQKSTGEHYDIHPNFHGSRDIYGVSKYLYSFIVGGRLRSDAEMLILIKNAIERNFNGAAYLFGERKGEIPFSLVNELAQKRAPSTSFSNIRLQDIGSPYDQVRKQIPQDLNIFSSSQIFKQLFLNNLPNGTLKQNFMSKAFFDETPVLEQVTANILDDEARYLLIKSEGEVVDNLFMDLLKTIMSYREKPIPIKDWRGIKGKENSIELLTTLKNYITLGFIVVMKNLDDLYGSLYDLFNQKFTEVENRKYCYLYFGENKHKVEVHANFKAIILLDAEKEMKGRELELEQPAPFLNRFEKFFVRMSNLLPEPDMRFIHSLVGYLHTVIRGRPFRILGMSIDMIASIHKKAREKGGSDKNKVQETIIRLIYRMSTSHFLLHNGLKPRELTLFKEEHPFENLDSAINFALEKPTFKMCLFTMSNPIEIEGFRKDLVSNDNSRVFVTTEEMLKLGLEARAEKIKKMSVELLTLQFTDREHLELLSQLKSSILGNDKIKRVIFVIHVDRKASDAANLNENIGLNYWDDWENYVIEDISGVKYDELSDIYDMSLKDILFGPVAKNYLLSLKVLKETAVVTLQRIIMETNDDTLTKNFQSIRDMFILDEDNVYVIQMLEKLQSIVDSTEKWRALVVQYLGENVNYIDMESAILAVISDPKRGLSDLIKKFMLKVNERLTNLASYAIHYGDKNRKVREVYRENFEEKLKATYSRSDILHAKHSYYHYRVPFLSQNYVKFFDRFSAEILVKSKDEYVSLASTNSSYQSLLVVAKKGDKKLVNVEESISNLEGSVFRRFTDLLKALYTSSDDIELLLKTETTLREELMADLVIGMMLTIEESASKESGSKSTVNSKLKSSGNFINQIQNKFKFFMELCKGMLNEEETAETYTDNLIVVASIIIVSYLGDLKYLFSLLEISNKGVTELVDMMNQKKSKMSKKFLASYELIEELKNDLQKGSIPDFGENFDIKKQKNIYADIMADSMRNSSGMDNKNFDLHYMVILLELLDNFNPVRVKEIKREINEENRKTASFGGKFDLTLTKMFIKKYILEIPKLQLNEKQVDSVTLVLSDYVNSFANEGNFDPFISDEMDGVYNSLDKLLSNSVGTPRENTKSDQGVVTKTYYQERVASSLAHLMSQRINAPTDYESIVEELQRIKTDETLIKYDEMLIKMGTSKKPRFDMLIVSLVDKLYFDSLKKLGKVTLQDVPKILNYLMKKSVDPNFTSLTNILEYSVIRLLYNSSTMQQIQSEKAFRAPFEQYLNFDLNKLDEYLSDANNMPTVYFLQEIIVREGNLSNFALRINQITELSNMLNASDPSQSIVFFNEDYQNWLSTISSYLDPENLNEENLREELNELKESLGGEAATYILGFALINKFFDSDPKDQLLSDVRAVCKNVLSVVNAGGRTMELVLEGIVDTLPIEVSDNLVLTDDGKASHYDEHKLKKFIYQFLLTIACFESKFKYDLNMWRDWAQEKVAESAKFPTKCFKLPIVFSPDITNMASVFENIIVERVIDGDYLLYKDGNDTAALLANLGVYKCSCGFIYSIGNCGYAMVEFPCPNQTCKKMIGGSNHKIVERDGHEHITTLSKFSELILTKYETLKLNYNMHPVMNKTSLELTPIKLQELGNLDSVRSYLCGEDSYLGLDTYDIQMQIRHLWDHLLIFVMPYLIEGKDSKSYKDRLEEHYQKFKGKEGYHFLKSMAERQITSFQDYLLAHIKNDLKVLSKLLGFRNPGSIMGYMRAIMSKVGESFMNDSEMENSNDILVDYVDMKNPNHLMASQIRIAKNAYGKETKSEIQKLFKSIVYRTTTVEAMKKELPDNSDHLVIMYKVLRHNVLDPQFIMTQFKEKMALSTKIGFLKYLAKYESLLVDFPAILDANVRMAVHFNLNYDKAFSISEAAENDILKLKEKDPVIGTLYEEFVRVWTKVIPEHSKNFPDIFSFAFQCNQEINVGDDIQKILNGETSVSKFLFLPRDYGQPLMVSIVQTLIKFHNKVVAKMQNVLNIELKNVNDQNAKKSIEYCSQSDYVGFYDYEKHLWDNFWYETSPGRENEINFDLSRIEFLCARNMKRQMINFEEDNIMFYNFRGSDQEAQLRNALKLIRKMVPKPMDQTRINDIKNSWDQEKLTKSYQFLLEVGDYALGNFLFNKPDKNLKEIIEERVDSGVQRFHTYDARLHGDYVLGNMKDALRAHREGLMLWEINHDKSAYEQPFNSNQNAFLKEFLINKEINAEDLTTILDKFTIIMIDEYKKCIEYDFPESLDITFEDKELKLENSELKKCDLTELEVNNLLKFKLNQYLRLKNRFKLEIMNKEKLS